MGYFPDSQFDEPCGGTCPNCLERKAYEQESDEACRRTELFRECGAILWNALAPLHGEELFKKRHYVAEINTWIQDSDLPRLGRERIQSERWPLFGVQHPGDRYSYASRFEFEWWRVRWARVDRTPLVVTHG